MNRSIKDQMAKVILASRARNEKIYKARMAGLTFEQVGEVFGLTRQRIQAIVKRIDRERKDG